jgi:hypothetical protein
MTHARFSRRAFFGRAATAPLGAVGAARQALPSKGWIIVALDWEYNDQFTYEGDGYHPQPKVYLDKAQAEAECRRQCDEFFTQTFPTPAAFEPDWEMYPNCDPETATWDDLRRDGFPDPYFLQEVEL